MDSARDELSASILDFELLAELMDSLSPQADSAITDLVQSGGRIIWATFTRKYGDIREMGAGKRDRERPHLKPSSTTEILFYRGLLARAFFETDKGSQEFAYIPDDLLLLIESRKAGDDEQPVTTEALGRPASPITVLPAIADGSGKGRMASTLADPALRAQHVADIVALVVANGYDGIDLDYEVFAFSDGSSSWGATQPNWTAFVTESAQR